MIKGKKTQITKINNKRERYYQLYKNKKDCKQKLRTIVYQH